MVQGVAITHASLMEDWARIIAGLFCTFFYLGFAAQVYQWLKNPQAGHKAYLRCIIAYFLMMSVYRGYWVFALYIGTRKGITYVTMLSAAAACFLYFATSVNARKIENTLECSEKESKDILRATNEFKQEMEKVNTRADALVKRQELHIAARQEYKHPKGA